MHENQSESKSPRRTSSRFFRFGLRSFLLLMALISIVVGLLHQRWYVPWQSQKDAISKIRASEDGEMGGFTYDSFDELPWWKQQIGERLGKDSVTKVARLFAEGTGEPMDISAWAGIASAQYVGFDRAIVHDLSGLQNLKNLKTFSVFQAGAQQREGEVGLEVLGTLKKLETVDLHASGFSMSTEILDSICDATSIKKFKFDSHQGVDDFAPLSKLKNLEELELYVSDWEPGPESLAVIGQLPKLKKLTLRLYCDNTIDYSFLSGMEQLEALIVGGRLTADRKVRIEAAVPKGCSLEFHRP